MKIIKLLWTSLSIGIVIISLSCNKQKPAKITETTRYKDSLAIIASFEGIMKTYARDQKKAMDKIDSILPEIKKKQFITFQMKLYGFLITEYARKNDILKARAYGDSIRFLALRHKDSIYQVIGQFYAGQIFGSREKSFIHLNKSLSYNKNIKDSITYINSLNELAKFSIEEMDYPSALNYINKCIRIQKLRKKRATLAFLYAYASEYSYFMKDANLMQRYLDSASVTLKKNNIKDDRILLRSKGLLELLKGNDRLALNYLNQDIAYYNTSGIKNNILVDSYKIKAFENLHMQDSIHVLLKKIKDYEVLYKKDIPTLTQYYPLKIKYSEGAEKVDYMQRYIDIQNKVIEDNKGIQIAKIQYAIERKELENHLQKEKKLKKKNNFIYLLAILLVILASIIIFFFMNTKRKNLALKNKKLELDILKTSFESTKIERERISRELHDDLGAIHTSISMAASILKEQNNIENSKYLDVIYNNSARMNQKINEVIWSLNNRNDNLESLTSYIINFSKRFLENTPIHLNISKNDEIVKNTDTFVSSEKRRAIYLTCKEILNNIVKHSEASEAKLIFNLINDKLHIIISDNGKGLGEQNEFCGNGLKNIKENLKFLCADYEIETSDKGTAFKIIVKI